jgi:hypothetical protein
MTVAASITPTRVVRHPFRGALAGLLLGIGLALVLFSFSVIALGTLAPLVVIGLGVVVGVVLALVVPARGASAAPADAVPPPAEAPPGTF